MLQKRPIIVLLQKRPIIVSILLSGATPYLTYELDVTHILMSHGTHVTVLFLSGHTCTHTKPHRGKSHGT